MLPFTQEVAIMVKVKELLNGTAALKWKNLQSYSKDLKHPVSTTGSIKCRSKVFETTTNHPRIGAPYKISQHVLSLMVRKVQEKPVVTR